MKSYNKYSKVVSSDPKVAGFFGLTPQLHFFFFMINKKEHQRMVFSFLVGDHVCKYLCTAQPHYMRLIGPKTRDKK